MDGDGVGDLIVGVPYASGPLGPNVGMVRVFSGRTGEVLHVFHGPQEPSGFGSAVDGAGDVNGDGHADLIVGANYASIGSVLGGNVFVYSGKDGSLLHRFDASPRYVQLGHAVAGVGDLDQDGFPDLVVGAPGAGDPLVPVGRTLACSGKTGKLLWVADGSVLDGGSGDDVNSAGDVDGDGLADVIVGAPWSDPNGWRSGAVRVILSSAHLGTPYCTPPQPTRPHRWRTCTPSAARR